MDEKERQQVSYLIVLICSSIFTVILFGEALVMGWEISTILLILAGILVCWWAHILHKFSPEVNLYINTGLTLIAFVFYGSHETSIYDLAPAMIFGMLLYAEAEKKKIIDLFMITYALTMLYDFVFVLGGIRENSPEVITRIIFHFALILTSGYLIKIGISRREKDRQLKQGRIAELAESNRRTEDFLTNVSHELRTPINAVTGITSTILKRENDAKRRKDIYAIQMAGQRLFNQVEDILDFTEIDTGHVMLSEEVYMVSSLINDVINLNIMRDGEKHPELIVNLEPAMPAALVGDGRKIKKILNHLIHNGMKFTKEGAVYVKAYTMKKPYGVNLCLKVKDTGSGIAEEELSRIKESFYQSNSGRNRRAGGLGLGLSIVYGLVSAMEGFIQIESEPGQGTEVTVSIPQKVEDYESYMKVQNKEGLCVACFIEPEKYKVPEVRTFYNEIIADMVTGLDIPLWRASNIDELTELARKYRLTHIFAGKQEFLRHRAELDRLDSETEIVVAVNDKKELTLPGRYKLLQKPFYCLPVVNILNAGAGGMNHNQGAVMSCPGVRVLIVDDEPMNLMVAEGIFKGYQMEVQTAQSGQMAIELCEQEWFDLIFLDHMMPEMDGIETLKRIRRIHPEEKEQLTVIAFTANAVSGAREMFLKEGFDEFISKPIETGELERVLRKLLPKASIVYEDAENVVSEQQEETQSYDTDDAFVRERLTESGLDIQAGLAYCQDDFSFYKELLAQFARDSSRKIEKMEDYYGKGDWGNYQILIHSLKSSAKTIGADVLSEMAKAGEAAAKENDEQYIRTHHKETMELYKKIAESIKQLTGNEDRKNTEDEKNADYRTNAEKRKNVDYGTNAEDRKNTEDEKNADYGTNTENRKNTEDEKNVDYGTNAENRRNTEDEKNADDRKNTESGGIKEDDFLQFLSQLKECFATFEGEKAAKLINSMKDKQFKGRQIGALLDEAAQNIDDFEFEPAAEIVDEIIRKVEGGEWS